MTRLPLRWSLTIWYTLALVAALGLFAADVLWEQRRMALRRIDDEIDGFVSTAVHIFNVEIDEGEGPEESAEQACKAVAIGGSAIAVFDGRGALLGSEWPTEALPLPAPPDKTSKLAWSEDRGQIPWRIHSYSRTSRGGPFTVLVGKPLTDMYRERREIVAAIEIATPLIFLLAGGGGLWLATLGLRPIRTMAARAEQISPAGVDDLGYADRHDELGQFARSFNGLLFRLRAAVTTRQQFMADASHELRTPVSVVRSAADIALSREHRDEPEYRETLEIVGGQARRLTRLVDNMLVLARADSGGQPLRPSNVYLDELVTECCKAVGTLALERHVSIRTQASVDIPFRGDEDLLRHLLLNVIQNAVQHTRPHGFVDVTATSNATTVDVVVEDTGAGIAVADRERIFERFVQLDPSRRGEGTGLGLPIARWIAEAHGGTLTLASSGSSGSRFWISLPHTA